MKQGVNPHEDAKESARQATDLAFITLGRVSAAPKKQTDGEHHIDVQQTGEVIANDVPVLPKVHGDYYIPPEGAPVFLAADGEGEYVAIAAGIPNLSYDTEIDPGERYISHPLTKTNIHFDLDGKTEIHPEILPPPDMDEIPWRPIIKWLDQGEMTIKGDSGDDHWKPHIKFLRQGEVEIKGETGDDRNEPKIYFKNNGGIVLDGDTGPDHKSQRVEYNADGSIDVESDDGTVNIDATGSGKVEITTEGQDIDIDADGGDVQINGGTTNVVTDVTYDSANDDIVVHRNTSVKIPSGDTTTTSDHA